MSFLPLLNLFLLNLQQDSGPQTTLLYGAFLHAALPALLGHGRCRHSCVMVVVSLAKMKGYRSIF